MPKMEGKDFFFLGVKSGAVRIEAPQARLEQKLCEMLALRLEIGR